MSKNDTVLWRKLGVNSIEIENEVVDVSTS